MPLAPELDGRRTVRILLQWLVALLHRNQRVARGFDSHLHHCASQLALGHDRHRLAPTLVNRQCADSELDDRNGVVVEDLERAGGPTATLPRRVIRDAAWNAA